MKKQKNAALVHDIGIRASEKKFGHQNGKLQEQEGPAVGRDLLTRIGGYTEEQITRICWLVAHHHTYHVSQAFKSGLSYKGKDIDFKLTNPEQGFFEMQAYTPFFREHCETCGSRMTCNGCSNCGNCE